MSPKPVKMPTNSWIGTEFQKYQKAETWIEKQLSLGTNLFLK